MDEVTLPAEPRSVTGKKVRALRRTGITPIHVYGPGMESLSLQADAHTLMRTLAQVGYSIPLTIAVDGEEHFVLARAVQRHSVTEQVQHVDFLQVSRTQRLAVDVPLELVGEAPATRRPGMVLAQELHALRVEALPTDLPGSLQVDISPLDEVDKAVHASDVPLPSSVTLLTEPGAIIAKVAHLRAVVEAAVAAPEGEAAAEAAGAPPPEHAAG